MTTCTTCNASWSEGAHTEGCKECGGGAMTRSCAFCGGYCGLTHRRAVLDSQDSGEAHWIGMCQAACPACKAEWFRHAHTHGCPCCGGGGLIRTCPHCEGACGTLFERDVRASCESGNAHWRGTCTNG